MNKVAIIILSYNSLNDTTKPCLESLYSFKTNISHEIIVVDNNSTDGTRKYLMEEEKKRSNLKVIYNDVNMGFAAGNNLGIKSVHADYYVLLNNDTLVTDYWLDNITNFFENHHEFGLVGPISNSVGNEQKIFTIGHTEKEIIEYGIEWTEKCRGDYFQTDLLGFYCVAIKNEVFDKIGLLDESFGIGMFEDDDFCLRARQANYKLACLEDVFVYHKGSFSFNKLTNLSDLFYRNLEIYQAKHGIGWKTNHSIAVYINLINNYLENIDSKNYEKIIYKIHNKINVINRDFQLNPTDPQALMKLDQILNSKAWKAIQKYYYYRDNNKLFSFCYRTIKSLYQRAKKLKNQFLKSPSKLKSKVKKIRSYIITDRKVYKKLNEIKKEVNGKRIIVFPTPLDWNIPLFQRPQQLAKAYSKKENTLVIYFSDKHKYDDFEICEKVSDDLWLVDSKYVLELNNSLKQASEIIISISWTGNKKYLDLIRHDKFIYEYIDELSLFTGYSDEMIQDHSELLKKASVSVATATKLYDEIKNKAYNPILSPNAGDYEFFSSHKTDEANELIRGKLDSFEFVIGYYGALASWFDYALVKEIASQKPEWVWLLVGWNYDDSLKEFDLLNLPNVIHIEAQPYHKLPSFLNAFDVATLPFKINEITLSTSPVKVFEYMAGSKPIITSNLPECAKYTSLFRYNSTEEFISYVNQIKNMEITNEYWDQLENEAKENTWRARTDQILEAIYVRN